MENHYSCQLRDQGLMDGYGGCNDIFPVAVGFPPHGLRPVGKFRDVCVWLMPEGFRRGGVLLSYRIQVHIL